MKNRKFIKIINTVLIAVFVFAAFNIGKIYYDYNKANNTYEVIQDEYIAVKRDDKIYLPNQSEEEFIAKLEQK